MKKQLFLTTVILSLVLCCSMVFAAPLVIKLAHEEPANVEISPAHASALVFKDVVEAQSNGEMQVKIYAASSMGNQRERMEELRADILQVNIASGGGIAPFYPLINVLQLPFCFPNNRVAYKVFDGPFGDRIQADMSKKTGFRWLMLTAGDFYIFTNSVRPIHSPKDMKGIKFRTMAIPSHIALMRSLGAAATPIPWDELYGGLQTGVVEGQHNPISTMALANLQEVQKYATISNHLYGGDMWLTSDSFYNAMTDSQKQIFNDALEMAKVAGNGHKLLLKATDKGVNFLKKSGLEVYAPSPQELASFKEISQPAIMKTIKDDLGDEGMEMANALLDATRKAEQEISAAN